MLIHLSGPVNRNIDRHRRRAIDDMNGRQAFEVVVVAADIGGRREFHDFQFAFLPQSSDTIQAPLPLRSRARAQCANPMCHIGL